MENKKKLILALAAAAVVLAAAIIAAVIVSNSKNKTAADLQAVDTEKFTVAQPRTEKPILYIKNGALFAKAADGSGESHDLSGNLCAGDIIESASVYMDLVFQSKNADTTYFIKDYSSSEFKGNLYATTDYNTSFQVDSNIFVEPDYEYIKLSSDGKTALYMKNLVVGESELYGDLCYSKIENGQTQITTIAEGIYCSKTSGGIQTSYIISPNGKYMAAYSEYNPEKQVGGLIFVNTEEGQKNLVIENISDLSLINLTDDGTLIFSQTKTDAAAQSTASNACIINYSDMIVKEYGVAVNSDNIYISENSDKFVYVDNIDNKISTYSMDNSKAEPSLISDKYFGFTSVDPKNECYIFAQSEDMSSSETAQKVYIKTPEFQQPELICENISLPKHIKPSVDYKKIYYLTNYDSSSNSGDLYCVNVENGKLSNAEKIASSVYSFSTTQGGTRVVFETDYNKDNKTVNLKAYDSKGITSIADNIKIDSLTMSVDGETLVFSSDLNGSFNAPLKKFDLSKNKGSVEVIDSDASMMFYYYDNYTQSNSDKKINMRNEYHVRGKDRVLFYKNIGTDCRSGELYLYNGKENILIDKDVNTVLFE